MAIFNRRCHFADNYTFVTSFIDIGRSDWQSYARKNDEYLQNSVRLLQFNAPLILFIEDKFIDFVKKHRTGKENITKIVAITIRDSKYFKLYANISSALQTTQALIKMNHDDEKLLKVPEVLFPEYIIIMSAKVDFIKWAIEMNPFHSSFFFWIDFGFARTNDALPSDSCWAPRNFMTNPVLKDKVFIVEIFPLYFPFRQFSLKALFQYLIRPKVRTLNDFIKHRGVVFTMGGFFGGSTKAMLEFNTLYDQVFERALASGFTDDDQTMITLCFLERNDLFYNVLSLNEWFAALHLLN